MYWKSQGNLTVRKSGNHVNERPNFSFLSLQRRRRLLPGQDLRKLMIQASMVWRLRLMVSFKTSLFSGMMELKFKVCRVDCQRAKITQPLSKEMTLAIGQVYLAV